MIGKCTKMCSFKEYHLRKEAKLLSRFETDEETCIAEFTRPGVGQMSNPSYIRTGNTLMKTTVFLLGMDRHVSFFCFFIVRLRHVETLLLTYVTDIAHSKVPTCVHFPQLQCIFCLFHSVYL